VDGSVPLSTGTVHYATSEAPLHNSPSFRTSSSFDDHDDDDAKQLAQAVKDITGATWLAGQPLAATRRLVQIYPGKVNELLALVPDLKGLRSPAHAVEILSQKAERQALLEWPPPHSDTPAGPARDPERLAYALQRLIATCEQLGDPEGAERYKSELSSLQDA
jgi:hypothetical protein